MVDYSKWEKIEVSDDEYDTHPNIDTPSLFRWRHKARVERMEAMENKEKNFGLRKSECLNDLATATTRADEFRKQNPGQDLPESLSSMLSELQTRLKNLQEEEESLEKEKKSQPWNVDTMSKEKYSKSIINDIGDITPKPKTDEEVIQHMQKFSECHEKEAKHFGMLSKARDSAEYLKEHPYLASEDAAAFLCIWCIDLVVEEKYSLMERIAKQAVALQFLLEVAKAQKAYPRELIDVYFTRFLILEGEHKKLFEVELEAFKQRVMERAQARIDAARASVEAEERAKRLGPGGLDPVEVMESLPPQLQKCFETRDTEMLQSVLTSMPPEEAHYHFKRCIDSGLWIENSNPDEVDAEGDYETPNFQDCTPDENSQSPVK